MDLEPQSDLQQRLDKIPRDKWLFGQCQKRFLTLKDLKPFDFPQQLTGPLNWLNTKDNRPLSFQSELKGKFVVIDFWTSCCINCIHVIAELEKLEHTFREVPEVAFIGCHSAKFDREEALYMLRSAVRRYDVKHAVVNDCHFDIWNSQKLNNWPTLLLISPQG
jgi:thiol-disulfide isomerase/thioredoxin